MKIALIIERTDVALGGAERSIAELAKQLRLVGHDVTVLTAKDGSQRDGVICVCHSQARKRVSMHAFQTALLKHFVQNSYDIIHSTLPFPFVDIYQPRGGSYKEAMIQNTAAYPNTLIRSCKRMTHFLNRRRTKLLNAERALCTHSQVTVAALSDYVKTQFVRHYQLSDDRLITVPNGIQTEYSLDNSEIQRLRKQIYHTINQDDPKLLLFAANNFRLKGLRPLMYSLSRINKQHRACPAYIVVVGKGKKTPWLKLAEQLDVKDRFVFLNSTQSIWNLLAACDAAVLPSYYDPCSRFILEALTAQKPVITTRYNGACERYTHRKHGIILDHPDSIESLAEAIGYFCDEYNIDAARKAISNDNLNAEISIKKHVQRLLECYNAVLERKGKSK